MSSGVCVCHRFSLYSTLLSSLFIFMYYTPYVALYTIINSAIYSKSNFFVFLINSIALASDV